MRTLKTAAGILVALIFVGLPPLLGFMAEARLRARLAQIQQSGVYSAELRAYERSWFRGRAKIELGLSPAYREQLRRGRAADLPLLDETLPLDVELAYGPVAMLDGVHFGLSQIVAGPDPASPKIAALEQRLGVPQLFEFRGRTSFLGATAFDADVSPVDLVVGELRVQFSGAAIAGTQARKHVKAAIDAAQFEFSSPTGAFRVQDVHADVDNDLVSAYLMPGNVNVSVASVAIVDAARGAMPVLDVANARFASDIELDTATGLLDVAATYSVEKAFVDGTEIGDARVGVAMRDLDAAAAEAYLEARAAHGGDAAAALDALRPSLERALARGPSLALDPVTFAVDGEKLTARAEVTTNVAALPPAGALDLADTGALLAIFGLSADVDVSQALAQRVAALAMRMEYANDPTIPSEQARLLTEAQSGLVLVALVSQGILRATDDGYRAEVRVAGGDVTLNGAPLPFALP
jgi:uncharacterized protein YdgA (DUF945 family)